MNAPWRSALLAVLALAASAAMAHADAPKIAEPLFSRHVVPLFSKLGCNAGSCHGAVKGQNGFRLSLFGMDAALDHRRLVREFDGRRLNFNDPDASLLLLKAMGQLSHQGGVRLAAGSAEHRLLPA